MVCILIKTHFEQSGCVFFVISLAESLVAIQDSLSVNFMLQTIQYSTVRLMEARIPIVFS
jgi:hypothetical protein